MIVVQVGQVVAGIVTKVGQVVMIGGSGSSWSSSSWEDDDDWSSSGSGRHYSSNGTGIPMRIPLKSIVIVFTVLGILAVLGYKNNKHICNPR